MKVDFSKYTSAVSGAMTMAKAALLIFPPNGELIRVDDKDAGTSAGAPSLPGHAAADGSRTVTFQFNPAALRISAYGGGMAPITSYGSRQGAKAGSEAKDGCDMVNCGSIIETVTVSFKVVFDALRNPQAFLSDRVNPGPTNLARQGADRIRSAGCTVRPVAEGFLASVRNSSTRRVIFQWGGMRYGGYLNKAQCRYTMFDIVGEAVRAEVDLTLVCSCHNDYNNEKEWRDRYDAFMKDRVSVINLSENNWRSALNVVRGKVEKACILFHAKTKQATDDEVNAEKNRLSDLAARISNKANSVKDAGIETLNLNDEVNKAEYIPVSIHYNPSSITMHSRGGEMVTRDGNSAGTSDIGQFQRNAMPTETVLFMELIFDETNSADAFLLDSGMGSPTGLIKAGKDLRAKMAGRDYSVAQISELFVAATASAYTRLVCFVWNKMTFWGELCEAEVEYTMFNNRGNPIRSKVSIRIRQGGDSDKNGSYEKIWQSAYQKLPEESEKLAASKRLTGSSGNLAASNLFRM